MIEHEADASEELVDPIALARLFIAGRAVKRTTLVQMVRALLLVVEKPVECISRTTIDIPAGIPNVSGYDGKPPILVQVGAAGSIFLGPDANRYFTRSEAVALAGAIARATMAKNSD